jgi:hypothetical protein
LDLAQGAATKDTKWMDAILGSVESSVGARFFDRARRDIGWAGNVAKRPPALGGLTVLDVMLAEPLLAENLRTLDKSKLVVHCDGLEGASYRFMWASGYTNGNSIRIQGVLE